MFGRLHLAGRNTVTQAVAGLRPAIATIDLAPLLAATTLRVGGARCEYETQSDDNQRHSQHFALPCVK